MARKEKSRRKDGLVEKFILTTAVLNLVKALIDLIKSLTG